MQDGFQPTQSSGVGGVGAGGEDRASANRVDSQNTDPRNHVTAGTSGSEQPARRGERIATARRSDTRSSTPDSEQRRAPREQQGRDARDDDDVDAHGDGCSGSQRG